MALSLRKCEHIEEVSEIKRPQNQECAECVRSGDKWVHLRTCQHCGITLCCDSSPNKHARKHSESQRHPVIISAEPGERWIWCYEHEQISKY